MGRPSGVVSVIQAVAASWRNTRSYCAHMSLVAIVTHTGRIWSPGLRGGRDRSDLGWSGGSRCGPAQRPPPSHPSGLHCCGRRSDPGQRRVRQATLNRPGLGFMLFEISLIQRLVLFLTGAFKPESSDVTVTGAPESSQVWASRSLLLLTVDIRSRFTHRWMTNCLQ